MSMPSEIFVGRSHELALLEAVRAEVAAGNGRLALITGEPGIGKSRLAEEATRRAEADGWASAWGRSWEGPGTPAYWPWTQILRRLELQQALEPVAGSNDAEHARFLLCDRVARALQTAGTLRPLLLVLDDVHAADAATLGLLRFVAGSLRGARVMLLATSRDAAFAAAGTTALLAQVAREARQVPLSRLLREDLDEWVARAAPRLEAGRVWAASEGNPLFVEELLATAKKQPDAAWTTQQMPLGIREAMRAHLALASERALALLEAASVLGREPSLATLKAIAGPDELAALDEALASGVLRDAGEGRLRFSHILLRDELYARLPAARRAELHRRAARASQSAAAVAHHALAGAQPEDASATLVEVQRAMREASGRLAHEDAAVLGRRALESLGSHLSALERCGLEVAIGEALVLAGDLPGGQAVGERAAAQAAELGDANLLARAVLTRCAEIAFAGDPGAVEWLRRGLAALPEADSPLRAQVMARLAASLHNDYTALDQRQRLRDDAIAIARRLGDEKALMLALHNASGTFPSELPPRERFALFAETVALAEKMGTIGRITPLLGWHVVSWLELGEPDGARAAADRVEQLLAPYPQPHYRWRLPLIRAVLASVAGRFDEADRLARESLGISRAHGIGEGLMMWSIWASTLPYVTGDDRGMAEAAPIFERNMGGPMGRIFSAMHEAPMGRVDRVRESFELLKKLPMRDVTGAAQLGWACVRAGLPEYAEMFYQLSSADKSRSVLLFGPGGCGCVGPAALLRGHLAAMTGRRDEAIDWLEQSVAVSREVKSPPFLAHSELAWAEVLAGDDPGAAAGHARIAYEQASAVGMATVAARAEKLMGARSKPSSGSAPELTLRRDGETWSIAAGGRPVTLVHGKGLAYLEALIAAPHRPVHVLELSGLGEEGDAGPQLDEQAKRAYRARAEELREELEEATAFNDAGRLEKAQEELDQLGAEMARALGLGGRDRRAGSVQERARINVQRRLKDTIRRVAEQDEMLGRHLELSVKTGLFCMYAPTWPQR